MKAPKEERFQIPTRFPTTNHFYAFDATDLLESGETITTPDVRMLEGDTVVSQVNIDGSRVVFRLSGGSTDVATHRLYAGCTTSLGDTDGVEIVFKMKD